MGAVDPDSARRVAEEILADERFHPRRGPRPFEGFFRRIGELVVDPILRAFDWVGDVFPEFGTAPWLLIAAAVVVAAAVVTVRLSGGRTRRRSAAGSPFAGDDDGLDPDELERWADDAERRGELDTALRLRFRAGLLRLADLGAVRLRPGLTNSAVSRTLRSPRFDDLALHFDEVAYGGRPATQEDLVAARSTWPAVLNAARTADEAPR